MTNQSEFYRCPVPYERKILRLVFGMLLILANIIFGIISDMPKCVTNGTTKVPTT